MCSHTLEALYKIRNQNRFSDIYDFPIVENIGEDFPTSDFSDVKYLPSTPVMRGFCWYYSSINININVTF